MGIHLVGITYPGAIAEVDFLVKGEVLSLSKMNI